ncbi:N-acetylmuramoyl-L-alanine amidase [Chitinophaga pendula]|uniref:N-acetylmuramoyl-L-alanine amidase family protein n=1 Tax=Chitinophaga TaxID=79328 RepID=UPI000BAEAA60|nr:MULTISPECIES: N-acetylmuramoyl-L-alanine amidase [Chitinophaga]ASZ10635.1 hypothetical protein CK934_06415 [Chitinophaga sp. MD30]UCJ06388.1 N-acetylmuramoyl-L-alanine amidase [Chitinophaga pendula]
MRIQQFLLGITLTLAFTSTTVRSAAQTFIRLVQPTREENNTSTPRQFISGRTCQGCKLSLNNDSIYVYPTGSFAIARTLTPGTSRFVLTATDTTGKTYSRNINYYYNIPPAPTATPIFRIDYLTVTPKGNLRIMEGDTIRIRMKGYPGCQASWINGTPIKELPTSQTGGVPGIYAGSYVITEADSTLQDSKLYIMLKSPDGSIATKESSNRYSFLQSEHPFVGRTIDNMTYLNIAPEGDRLGPDKLGYLDKNVLLEIAGQVGDYYKVKLAPGEYAYVPEPLLDTATLDAAVPVSIVSQPRAWGDATHDYVSIQLSEKLPYLSTQDVNPGKITVDVYGAYSEPGLQALPQGTKEISRVGFMQLAPNTFRINIALQHRQPWGYQLYYEGNNLVIKVKRPPASRTLSGLTIGLDAGHGGSNVGAMGPAGIYEKQLTLAITSLLKTALEKEGVRIITTRTRDQFFANEERLSFYRKANPDLLLSIHLNSAANPVDIKGTAVYYKHPFCQPLANAIYKRMQETGLSGFANNNNFNFILNNPTEFPDVLVETLFLSNPEDEMKALDPAFQQLMADKIVQGLKDFLATSE